MSRQIKAAIVLAFCLLLTTFVIIASAITIYLEAETFNQSSDHVGIADSGEGSNYVGWINNGEWIRFDNVDFGRHGVHTFRARVASAEQGGIIYIRLDAPYGTLVGTCQVPPTGGWLNWITITCPLNRIISGNRSVFLEFHGPTGYLFNINWIQFHD